MIGELPLLALLRISMHFPHELHPQTFGQHPFNSLKKSTLVATVVHEMSFCFCSLEVEANSGDVYLVRDNLYLL